MILVGVRSLAVPVENVPKIFFSFNDEIGLL